MLKFLVLPALLVLALTMACSSLSVEDYAEWCGEWEDDYNNVFDGDGDLSDMEDALEEWNAVNPPGEVKELHDLVADFMRAVIDIAEQGEDLEDQLDDLEDELEDAPRRQRDDIRDEIEDVEDELEDLQEDFWDEIFPLAGDIEDVKEDLPRRVQRELEREDCNF